MSEIYNGKFQVGQEKPHLIYDLKTGIEFAIYAPWEVGDRPDEDRAKVMCEYLNRIDVLTRILVDCRDCLDSSGHSPETVKRIDEYFDTIKRRSDE